MLRSKTIPQTQIIPAEESDDGIITAAVLESRLIETKDLIGLDIEDVQESIDKKTEGYFVSLINQMQGVNNNLEAISDTIRRDMRDRKKYFDMQKELFEDDEENLKLIDVKAIIYLKDKPPINISSDFAFHNKNSFDTN